MPTNHWLLTTMRGSYIRQWETAHVDKELGYRHVGSVIDVITKCDRTVAIILS